MNDLCFSSLPPHQWRRRGTRFLFNSKWVDLPENILQLCTSLVLAEGHKDQDFESCLKVTGCEWLVDLIWQSRIRSTGNGQNFLNLARWLISESPVWKVRPYKGELAWVLCPRTQCRGVKWSNLRYELLATRGWWKGSYMTSWWDLDVLKGNGDRQHWGKWCH